MRNCARRFLIVLALCLAGVAQASAQMNVIVVVTDDQRFDTLSKTPNIAKLAAKGVQFTRAYQPTPVCGPARASLFSGGFLAQNTGVLENDNLPNGGIKLFNDRVNLGTVMQQAGYRTMFAGKWVNGYETQGRYVPPGWSRWVGRHSYANQTSWYAFRYVLGGSGPSASSTGTMASPNAYTAYYERDQILRFLDGVPSGDPFFVLWSPSAPHEIAMPAAQDSTAFSNFTYRGRGVGETDLSDKPRWVRTNKDPPDDDEFIRDQLRTMLSVDRSLQAIVDKVRAMGELSNTVIMFTSDNGYLWNEHGLWRKDKPYEESLRVPFFVVMPGVAARTDSRLVSPVLDIGPTIYDLAGVTRATDGSSLVPLLRYPGNTTWRPQFFYEHSFSTHNGNALWAGVMNQRWKYVRYWTGEEELYDLKNDPFELQSRHADPALQTVKSSLASQTTSRLGLAVYPPKPPAARLYYTYNYRLRPWGGKTPFTWTVESGALPPGLSLDRSTGVISGYPTYRGTYTFQVRLTDSAYATQAKTQRSFVTKPVSISVS